MFPISVSDEEDKCTDVETVALQLRHHESDIAALHAEGLPVVSSPLFRLFDFYDDKPCHVSDVEKRLSSSCVALTDCRHSADRCLLATFHVTHDLSFHIFNMTELNDELVLSAVLLSCNNRYGRSGLWKILPPEFPALVALLAFVPRLQLYHCGLLESKEYPWMASQPDAIAVLGSSIDEDLNEVAVVEAHLIASSAEEKISTAVAIKDVYGNIITTDIDDDIWNACVPKYTTAQVLRHLCVTGFTKCLYVVATHATHISVDDSSSNNTTHVIYVVIGELQPTLRTAFLNKCDCCCGRIMSPFFSNTKVEDVFASLPVVLTFPLKSVVQLNWQRFHDLRNKALKQARK